MRYLVTGGCGFIGARLVTHLLSTGHEVVVLDDLSSGSVERLPAGVPLIEASVSDPLLSIASVGALDGVFHLAAVSSVEEAEASPDAAQIANVAGTRRVFEIAGSGRPQPLPVVFTSSAAVYGNAQQFPIDESHHKQPLGVYGATKLEAEREAARAFAEMSVPSIGVRLFNVYGPWPPQAPPPPGVVATFCRRLAAGDHLVMHGSGRQRRDYLYLDDAITLLTRAMAAVRHRPVHSIVNGCTGVGTSLLQIAELLSSLSPLPVTWQHAAARPTDIPYSVGNPDLAGRLLRCHPKVGLAEGLARTFDSLAPAAPTSGPSFATESGQAGNHK